MEFLRTVAQWPELRGENTQTSGEEADIDEDDSDGEDYEDESDNEKDDRSVDSRGGGCSNVSDTESKQMQSNDMDLRLGWPKETGGPGPETSYSPN